ncbi:hypothetical protein [Alicyclobacillus kakegawensis]|uniref:hypothetical protein n=1 Tax=Alicyclobacillus kakegawensis TaxID=392012 RepID=UPI000AB1B60E|nr:hypothetical protein [Alicyclobacillus kakegawensis]
MKLNIVDALLAFFIGEEIDTGRSSMYFEAVSRRPAHRSRVSVSPRQNQHTAWDERDI